MRRIDGMWAGICLAGMVCSACAPAADAGWQIASPYPGNPLKVALLVGQGHVGSAAFPVTLELSCHPGVAVPRAVVRVPANAAGWDFSVFDGPSGGADQRRRTLLVEMRDPRVSDHPWFSGVRGEKASYMLSWLPSQTFMHSLTQPGEWVSVQLSAVRRSQGMLAAHFDFPAATDAMLAALAPCVHTQINGGVGDAK